MDLDSESNLPQQNQAGEQQDDMTNLLPKSNSIQRRSQDIDSILRTIEKNPNSLESKKRNVHRPTMEAIWNKLDF
ncbi:hypothetical protein H6G89_13485 [Oscillatoria sp. FACHB-1407]|uniref:hypothetical protein n=1 Tax=Oscillatoria sp. FACHB-1407 TaxID=2692847 RepID=UPI0016867DAC|nr:hypothetical protein [Oscillatoria sp. FACHB-1407]MBD2462061.1 hypothetical protein [Oscillatoria sp. FACHB-1407]